MNNGAEIEKSAKRKEKYYTVYQDRGDRTTTGIWKPTYRKKKMPVNTLQNNPNNTHLP